MRIRQRKVPFPLSSLSPVPLSDPHLISPSPVVVQLNDAMPPKPATPQPQQHAFFDHQPSPIGKQTDGSDSSASCGGFQIQELKKIKKEEEDCSKLLQKEEVEEDGGDREKNNDTRKGSIFGSETSAEVVFPPSSPSNQVDGRWCEGEKAIPLKKRRGSYERRVLADDTTAENNNNNNKKMKTRMKTKMNKKCSTQNHNEQDYDDDEDEEEYEVVERKPEPVVGKKRARGSALMEGSRCSRVNGRGWRCCQQTLVGYSLCEHHLGKGRLRSMTSVRSRSAASNSTAPSKNELANKPELPASSSSSSLEKQTKCDPLGSDNGEDREDNKPLVMTTKKRMKLGIVKARSISSLLGQTNTEVAVAENNK